MRAYMLPIGIDIGIAKARLELATSFKNAMPNYSLLRKRHFAQQTLLHMFFDLIRALAKTHCRRRRHVGGGGCTWNM